MITMEMSDDIRKYETKSIGPFTMRQVVCIAIALAYSVPIGMLTDFEISNKILFIAILALPVICCGYVKLDGTPFEVLAFRILYWMVLAPKKRKMKSKNEYRVILEEMDKKEERRRLSKMTPSQKKKYMQMKNSKTVYYSKKPQNKIYK